jgi:hypothetical protein
MTEATAYWVREADVDGFRCEEVAASVVGGGDPLIYSGPEAGEPRRLAFLEKDSIAWRHHPVGDLYRCLFAPKHANSALRSRD